jgi:hypothetical protein
MTSTYLIKDDEGAVINTIIADADFVEAAYPGRFELVEVEEPSPAPTTYKIITPTRYLALVKMASQMTNAEFAAYASDQHADMVYTRAMLASISGMIDINITDNMALVMEGLGYMAAHGHTGQIAPADFPAAILAAWAGL